MNSFLDLNYNKSHVDINFHQKFRFFLDFLDSFLIVFYLQCQFHHQKIYAFDNLNIFQHIFAKFELFHLNIK